MYIHVCVCVCVYIIYISGLKSFVAKVIDEISPAASSAQSPGGYDIDACRPVLIGKYVQKDGKDKGKIKTKVDRCTMCQKRNHRPDHGRAPRTSYCCAMHPKVSFVLPIKALASSNTRTSIQAVPTT